MISKCIPKKLPFVGYAAKMIADSGGRVDSENNTATIRILPNTMDESGQVFSIGVSQDLVCQQIYVWEKQGKARIVSNCFTFGPENVTFLKPVSIIIYVESRFNSIQNPRRIHRYEPTLKKWLPIDTSAIRNNEGKITAYQANSFHFSTYATFEEPQTPGTISWMFAIIVVVCILLLIGFVYFFCHKQNPRKSYEEVNRGIL